jgi:hypothetical protein
MNTRRPSIRKQLPAAIEASTGKARDYDFFTLLLGIGGGVDMEGNSS